MHRPLSAAVLLKSSSPLHEASLYDSSMRPRRIRPNATRDLGDCSIEFTRYAAPPLARGGVSWPLVPGGGLRSSPVSNIRGEGAGAAERRAFEEATGRRWVANRQGEERRNFFLNVRDRWQVPGQRVPCAQQEIGDWEDPDFTYRVSHFTDGGHGRWPSRGAQKKFVPNSRRRTRCKFVSRGANTAHTQMGPTTHEANGCHCT